MHALKGTELLTPEEYLKREALSSIKHEFLSGTVFAMSGASNRHNRIVTSLLILLGNQLQHSPCEPFNSDTKVRIRLSNQVRFYYPDAMVVCQANPEENSYQDSPVLVAEVLSESTRRNDLSEKKDAYLSIPSLQYLLLVEQDLPRIFFYQRRNTGFEETVVEGLDSAIQLDSLGCQISLAQLYRRVKFGDQPSSSPQTAD